MKVKMDIHKQPETGTGDKIILALLAALFAILPLGIRAQVGSNAFPAVQPKNGNFNHPSAGEVVDVSPPGFCWWRAGNRDQVFYRLHVKNEEGQELFVSEILDETACVPPLVFPAGSYTWTVDALSPDGELLSVREPSPFTIAEDAVPLPWIDPSELLGRVPESHPRLLFTGEKLAEIRGELHSSLQEPYSNLLRIAAAALEMPLVEKPDFDKYTNRSEYAAKRTAYRTGYHQVGDTYIGGVVSMALTYLLSGEEQYGEAVKAHLLHLTGWEMDGIMSVQDPKFDEVGLRLARALPQAYDWTYDIYTAEEQERIEHWMAGLADSMLIRMERRDFLFTSGESHDGRVPGYLLEFSIALADRPGAVAWMDYGMKAALTVFPHWAGSDGGWAEGLSYALQYNERFITPLQSVYEATGYNLWQKPFFRKFPYFLTYCTSPVGEITPFGDSEDQPVSTKAEKLGTMLLFYAITNNDSGLRWWVDLLAGEIDAGEDEEQDESEAIVNTASAIGSFMSREDIRPEPPANLSPDMVFNGIGWVAMHSDLLHADQDLMLLFKSSPFGPVSHSHLDQNSFAVMKGGAALALPAGSRYPQHGSPFHTRYTRLTQAHNTLLVNGNGQIDRDGKANGAIAAFNSMPHLAYALGEAAKSYGDPVQDFGRHVIMIRPSTILVVDELEASEPVEVEWLMHGKEKFILDTGSQSFISTRGPHRMKVELFSPGGIELSQDSAWPIDPKEGYPMVTTDSPAPQWHLTGKLNTPGTRSVVVALMNVDPAEDSPIRIRKDPEGNLLLSGKFEGEGTVEGRIIMDGSAPDGTDNLIQITYHPLEGEDEVMNIPSYQIDK